MPRYSYNNIIIIVINVIILESFCSISTSYELESNNNESW